MLKYIFIILILGIALAVFVQYRIQPVTNAGNGQPPVVSVRLPGAQTVRDRGLEGSLEEQSGRLSASEERLANRVAPVQEASIREEVLPQ
ncbi:MAG: hypothetical protein HGA80_00765 [Candidatus Omnitrophica bacterium]|nr:hypothetical protein [Candidatus Omnitrophota bacterium]